MDGRPRRVVTDRLEEVLVPLPCHRLRGRGPGPAVRPRDAVLGVLAARPHPVRRHERPADVAADALAEAREEIMHRYSEGNGTFYQSDIISELRQLLSTF